jgi:hypothetical protein
MSSLRLISLLALCWLGCADVDQLDLSRPDLSIAPDMAADQPPALDLSSAPDLPPDMAPDMTPGEDLGAPDMPDAAPDMPPDMQPTYNGPARYPATAASSPATARTFARWAEIRDGGPASADERVFIKVGASGTVNTRLLTCFEPGSSFGYALEGRDALQQAIDHFRQARVAGGTTSFARVTLAAEVGRTARWAVTGSPSPLDRELAALKPRYAFVNYGTNDMGGGATFESALWSFWTHMNTLLDALEAQGVIPIITGLNPRGDNAEAARWVPIYDAMTRGLAEQRQLPYLSLYLSTKDMPAGGLLGDGLHGNAWSDGSRARPCHFNTEALNYNYNLRNLESLTMLDRVWRALSGVGRPDVQTSGWLGVGTSDDPIIVDSLPFTHHGTTRGAERLIDGYPSCDGGQDEGGGEIYYKLVLDRPTTVRLMTFDREADVDLHLLDMSGDPMGCVERDDRTIERLLPAGEHVIVVDSFVSGGEAREGEFLFVAAAR